MSSQSEALQTTEEVTLQALLLCQAGIGTLANILLLVHNSSPVVPGSRVRPVQVIVTHVAVANALILLITAFPNKVMFFVPRKPKSNLKCKIEYFIRQVARSTNMCSTCVLSTYQFLTLVPCPCGRVMLRGRAPSILSYSCYSCWFFSVLNNVYIPLKVSGSQSTANGTDNSKWVCSTPGFSVGMVILPFAHHSVFISIMVWTSVSMVLLLHRHKKRVQHLHTPNQDQRIHPETRAVHTILMLVVTFVSFYALGSICNLFHISFVGSPLWLRHVGEVLIAGFPTVSPLLLIFRDRKNPCSALFNC
ncbi:vomeronasal type-1 receptor 1-like [Mesocricetus auratus]|uniref:Vomeronasal type-1 receptor n=1 Tax=Mesocricetus auratus TaxID=10036 RepID=A0A1U7QQW7_MESAU|nr:vomeronasal type-1 receptor 1-like [Mesocricetus auratus]